MPDGRIENLKLGNGLWEAAKFNTRLQVTELGLGSSATDAGVWKTQYEYGELDTNGNVDASKNTGNIARQTLTVPGTSFTQSYRYDSLYRLTEASETTGSATNWSQSWSYDRYGNRIGFAQDIAGNTNAPNPSVDPNTNRFNAGQGFGYDANGNVVSDIDPLTSLPRQFIFNGDNKQTEVKRDGVTIGRYFYDGEGKRVKKVTDTETTVFVYSAGKLIAEYSTQISQIPQTKYLTEDHLGTPRIITNELGAVVSRRDFMPFGEELYNGIGARSTNLQYGTSADDVQQKFTGYQKDNETGLDFAEARMYANEHGRFTSVDPLLASGRSSNPQTFNRFVYTGSNPIARTDPTGEDWILTITQVKIKEQVKVRGRIRTVEKTVDVKTPTWIPSDDAKAIPRVSGVWEFNVNGHGFQALHPTDNIVSDVFSTREEAQKVYDEWMRGTDYNPIIRIVTFDSTLTGPSEGPLRGPTGHVAFGVNDKTYSWDDTGFERDRSTSFSDYLDRNFEYRSGTITEFDFGSPGNNRSVANEIERGPRNAKFLHIFPSGYNLISNNCGETLCRIAERFELPKNNSIAPWSHQNYINNNMRSFIRVQSRQVPPAYRPRFSVPPIRPIPRPRPTPVQ